MKIVVDAMGGDNAPGAMIEGCVSAVCELGVEIILVGDSAVINNELSKYSYDKAKVEVVHASEVILNNEHPAMAIRKKKDSSIAVGLQLVKEGRGGAFISAGSTGALLAGAIFIIRRIKGISRPALAPIMPGLKGGFMIIDVGANVDCKPEHLLQFGIMGSVYYERVLNVKNPKVGLVNNGSEEEKGNELTKETFKLLKQSDLNFIGNIEPRDIPEGEVQVIVCDGFVGNTVLKLYEGAASMIFGALKEELMSSVISKIGALILKSSFKKLKKKFDYTEYGGAVLLGVNGAVIKAHGSSNSKAVKNAIRQAKLCLENNVVERIRDNVKVTELVDED